MNVPLPLTVLHGPSHLIGFMNLAQITYSKMSIPMNIPFVSAFPEHAKHALPILDRVFRDGIPFHEREIPVGDRCLNSSYFPLRSDDGSIEGVIVSTLDVTSEVEGREANENQKKWLELVLDLIPIPTVLVQPGSGKILMVNVAGKRKLAIYPPAWEETLQDKYYFTDFTGARLPMNDWPHFRAARGEELYGIQLVWNTPKRKIPVVIESRRLPRAYGHSSVVAVHYQDISDLKEAESALKDSVIDLQKERELRERFVNTLTHDLRNPLSAAMLSAQIVARENPENPKVLALSKRISGNIARADRMVLDLLDANRLKAGAQFPLRLGNHCLNEVVQSCLDGLSVLHGDRFHIEASTKISGRWCRSSLKRIVENLCGNAVKYGQPGALVTVFLEHDVETDQITIRVHNLGNAIPRSEQAGLFEPYHRTQSAVGGAQRGWGLGLALVRGLSEAHGGGVALDYSDERGTRFSVHMPRVVNV